MAEVVIMPKLGFNMDEGQLVKWHKQVGETLKKGEVLFEINGGEFVGDVFAVCRIGTNNTTVTPGLREVTMKITGGVFSGRVGLYQSTDSPRAPRGRTTLLLGGDAKSMQNTVTGFDEVGFVD